MTFEKLLLKPENFRAGKNYKASNIVFPVKSDNTLYIIKKPRNFSSMIELYYIFQSKFFYRSKKYFTKKQRLLNEVEKLKHLNGKLSPILFAYNNKLLVREYINGKKLNELETDEDLINGLESALYSLELIHDENITVGDAHVKNVLVNSFGAAFWLDFESSLGNRKEAKAFDLLKFVYSTYTLTRNFEITEHLASKVSSYPDKNVKTKVKDLVNEHMNWFSAWFTARIPNKHHKKIEKILLKC